MAGAHVLLRTGRDRAPWRRAGAAGTVNAIVATPGCEVMCSSLDSEVEPPQLLPGATGPNWIGVIVRVAARTHPEAEALVGAIAERAKGWAMRCFQWTRDRPDRDCPTAWFRTSPSPLSKRCWWQLGQPLIDQTGRRSWYSAIGAGYQVRMMFLSRVAA